MRLRELCIGLFVMLLVFLVSPHSFSPLLQLSSSGNFTRPKLRNFITNDTMLWFLHMQKTGGTFFSAFLLFAFDCICPANWRPEWAWSFTCQCPTKIMSMFSPGNASVYHANYTRLLRHYHKDGYSTKFSDLLVFTVLREPIARVVSEYHHCSKRRRYACWNSFRGVSDREWMRIRRHPNVFFEHPGYEGHNRQTRMLLGEAWRDPVGKADANTLIQEGKQRLDELQYVGLSERLEDSLKLFCWQFCLPCINQTAEIKTLLSYQINVQHSGYITARPMTEKLMAWVTEQNAVDAAVYTHAQGIFEERLETMRSGRGPECPR